MMDILKFMFSGFWHFVGCWLILGLICTAIVHVFQSFRPKSILEDLEYTPKGKPCHFCDSKELSKIADVDICQYYSCGPHCKLFKK